MQANIDMLAELNGAPPHQGCRACRTTTGFCVRVALQVYWPACVSILSNSRTYQDLVVLRTYHVREKNRIEGCRNQNHHHQPAAVW
jgi:hypothetical protein